jgi:hypothetical protein
VYVLKELEFSMRYRHVLARRTFLFILSSCIFFSAIPAVAKRSAPKPVPPVIAYGVEYSAPVDLRAFVVATDTRSHKELWRQRIYSVSINPALERDVQDVFITSLAVNGRALVITNEHNETYVLDLTTRQVSKRP